MARNSKNDWHAPIYVSGVMYRGPVGKKFFLSQEGQNLEKETLLGARAGAGKLQNLEFVTAAEYFQHRLNANSNTMYFAGTFEPGLADAHVVPEGRLGSGIGSTGKPLVAATKDNLAFRTAPGVISIDIDAKSADEVAAIHPEGGSVIFETPEQVLDALFDVLPEAKGHPVLVMPSSSSLIERKSDGKVMKGPGGWRILLLTRDASQTPRILNTVHTRCWAQGIYNFAFIDKGGRTQARSMADLALARPTQPDYPTATLGKGLRKVPDTHLIKYEDAPLFDPDVVDVSIEDRWGASENLKKVRGILKPAEARQKAAVLERQVKRLVENGVPKPDAQRAVSMKLDRSILLGADEVHFAGGDTVSVADLLSSAGESYDSKVCLDPADPEYDDSRPVAIFYWNDGKCPIIHSFAHGSRSFHLRYDESSATAAINQAGDNQEAIVHILALSEVNSIGMKSLEKLAAGLLQLGNSRAELREAVAGERRLLPKIADTETDPILDGPVPLARTLQTSRFPFFEAHASGSLSLIDHQENLKHMLDEYGIDYRYNVITKRMEWNHPEISSAGDNAENSHLSTILSLAALNGLPDKNIDTHLTALGNARSYNPVTEYLKNLEWDGVRRIEKLAKDLCPDRSGVADIALRIFFIQACAAADHAETAAANDEAVEAHFESVLVLVGDQGIGKTKGLKNLLPPKLRKYYNEGAVLNLSDKDSTLQVVGFWVVEMGEVDATFRTSDISRHKAFLSRSVDIIRAPYARKASSHSRRTVFVGTVNDESFLADETGNRRYLPVSVTEFKVDWPDAEIDQLWAEAWARYVGGEKWWARKEEEVLLERNAEKFRSRSEVEERIESHFAWDAGVDFNARRQTASQIYRSAMPDNSRMPLQKDLKTVGQVMKRCWKATGRTETIEGELAVKDDKGTYMSLNSQSGKNRGWILPPLRQDAECRALAIALKKQEDGE